MELMELTSIPDPFQFNSNSNSTHFGRAQFNSNSNSMDKICWNLIPNSNSGIGSLQTMMQIAIKIQDINTRKHVSSESHLCVLGSFWTPATFLHKKYINRFLKNSFGYYIFSLKP